ncbi:hypothetical protein K438DRAFT_1038295 [Mycena galopus ATCC 62051]|nr:hypothetical protein K438DRAFT_1038295 [Mycena galopus ATCC 62051]
MGTPISITGNTLPLDANFDFVAWRKSPKEIPFPVDMGLQERNTHNCTVETFNRASIATTRKYENDLKTGPTPDATRDVGPPLRPFFKYTQEEIDLMVASDDYCNKVVAPVPLGFIMRERIRIAKEKEEAKEKGPELLGSMVMTNVVQSDLLTRAPVSIPAEFLAAIKNKMHLPILWFTDARLRHATQFPTSMPLKKDTGGSGKWILNCEKLIQEWGSDETSTGVTPLQWLNTFENYIAALKQLSAKPDANNPFSYAIEMEKHRSYFANRPDFEPDFHIWYPIERELRNKILDNTAFDAFYWHSEAGRIVTGWKAATALHEGNFIVPTVKLADLAFNPVHLTLPPMRQTRDNYADRRGHRNYRDDGRNHRIEYGIGRDDDCRDDCRGDRGYRDEDRRDIRGYRDEHRGGDRFRDEGRRGRDDFREEV